MHWLYRFPRFDGNVFSEILSGLIIRFKELTNTAFFSLDLFEKKNTELLSLMESFTVTDYTEQDCSVLYKLVKDLQHLFGT